MPSPLTALHEIGAHLPQLLAGFGVSLVIAIAAMAAALLVGTAIAVGATSRWRIVKALSFAYIQVFRGVALYVLIIWVYFGLAIAVGVNFAPIPAGILTLALLNSAYLAEIIRTGLQQLGHGQSEAGAALGLSRWTVLTRVELPQALRAMIPAIGNQFTDVVKDTSILAVIAVPELMYVSQNLAQQDFEPFTYYTFAGVLYIIAVTVITAIVRRLERRRAPARVAAPAGTSVVSETAQEGIL
ncbi:MAG TPA: amino acid ABC transporter permease [Gryllotalpicola sp.]